MMIGFAAFRWFSAAIAAIVVPSLAAIAVSVSPTRTTWKVAAIGGSRRGGRSHRHAVAADDRGECPRADDGVGAHVQSALEAAERGRRLGARGSRRARPCRRRRASSGTAARRRRTRSRRGAACATRRAAARAGRARAACACSRARRGGRAGAGRRGSQRPSSARRCRRSARGRGRARAGPPGARRSAG